MGAHNISDWRKLPLSLTELCIDTTLRCGQSFRWRKINDEWHCVLQGRLVSLKQDSSTLHYRATWPKAADALPKPPISVPSTLSEPLAGTDGSIHEDDTASVLHSYFALSHSLSTLYQQWTATDPNFARRAPAFTGIRILNQDAWETLISFICSSNNNISRISQMVQKLCVHYGPYIGTIEGEPFHDFPGPDALAGSQVEGHLRELGFGYRAKYIAETARIVSKDRPAGWLLQLRNPDCPALGMPEKKLVEKHRAPGQGPTSYRAAHEALLQLTGVGPKVSDCVCLMGLGWGEAVPIDTHVWQIAQRDYNFGKGGKGKTLTKAMYDAVGDHFREIWGPQAGWAQSVLFTANLKSFAEQASVVKREVLAEMIEMDTVAVGQKPAATKRLIAKVKVETEETSSAQPANRSRKRTARTTASLEVETTPDEVAKVEVFTRRTSKRLKAAGV
ncbi:8-oxoguanine glycosylase ogg1 [Collariella sp. IMI 366227]|nr:8-oxoguanine glycosylase ogg1 [Collariella sp. IMI 366227]